GRALAVAICANPPCLHPRSSVGSLRPLPWSRRLSASRHRGGRLRDPAPAGRRGRALAVAVFANPPFLHPRSFFFSLLPLLSSPPALLARAVCVSTSRRAAASSSSSRLARSCSCCSDLRKSAVPASAVFFSWLASAPALVASAVCVSTSRRAAARSCSSRLA